MAEDSASIYGPPSQEALDARHETRQIRLRWIAGFAVALVLLVALLVCVCATLLHRVSRPDEAGVTRRTLVPEPRLQPSDGHEQLDWQDLQRLRAQEDAVLLSYAWIGPDKRAARIPIDRAMDLLVEHGLPTRQAREAQP